MRLKVAVTVVLAVNETVQVPVPLHPLLQPAKVDPAAGVAVKVTLVPLESADEVQVVPQLMPPISEVTVPEPVPFLLAERVYVGEPPPATSNTCSSLIEGYHPVVAFVKSIFTHRTFTSGADVKSHI